MHDSHRVQVPEPGQKLAHDVLCLVLPQFPLGYDPFKEFSAIDFLQNQVCGHGIAGNRLQVRSVEPDDVPVVQLRQNVELAVQIDLVCRLVGLYFACGAQSVLSRVENLHCAHFAGFPAHRLLHLRVVARPEHLAAQYVLVEERFSGPCCFFVVFRDKFATCRKRYPVPVPQKTRVAFAHQCTVHKRPVRAHVLHKNCLPTANITRSNLTMLARAIRWFHHYIAFPGPPDQNTLAPRYQQVATRRRVQTEQNRRCFRLSFQQILRCFCFMSFCSCSWTVRVPVTQILPIQLHTLCQRPLSVQSRYVAHPAA